MARLKSRQRFIPNGFKFRQPESNWPPPGTNPFQNASFDTVVQMVIEHRLANPFLANKHKWALDEASVANEVDAYCAAICLAHGWKDFVMEGAPPAAPVPFTRPLPPVSAARHVAVGAKTLAEMFGSEGPIKDQQQADARAATCLDCPKHDKGDWTAWFTGPAVVTIRLMLHGFKGLQLRTSREAELKFCAACRCPMTLKVWARLTQILAHMPAQDYADLAPGCWIRKEQDESENQRRAAVAAGAATTDQPVADGTARAMPLAAQGN